MWGAAESAASSVRRPRARKVPWCGPNQRPALLSVCCLIVSGGVLKSVGVRFGWLATAWNQARPTASFERGNRIGRRSAGLVDWTSRMAGFWEGRFDELEELMKRMDQ